MDRHALAIWAALVLGVFPKLIHHPRTSSISRLLSVLIRCVFRCIFLQRSLSLN
jgi:hypothetical protein